MKLLLIIVANEDAQKLTNQLLKEKYFVTKLASTGGLLMNGNTTLLVGTENDLVDNVINIISDNCKTRKQSLPNVTNEEYGVFGAYPVEVMVGGATIFVLDIDKYYKI